MKKKKPRISKPLFLLFSLSFSALLLIGATYSWLTYSDERINKVEAPDGKLKIAIEGQLSPLWLSPNLTTKRNVKVRNESSQSVFVRVSLEEVLLAFEIDTEDQSGNANLKEYSSATPTIKAEKLATWITGNYYQNNDKKRIYKAIQKLNYAYKQGEAARPADLTNLQLIFSPNVLSGNPAPADPVQQQYWIYWDGYFYYSELMYSTNESSILLESVHLKENAVNDLKGGLYTDIFKAEGVLANHTVYDAWSIPKNNTNPVYVMLEKQLN